MKRLIFFGALVLSGLAVFTSTPVVRPAFAQGYEPPTYVNPMPNGGFKVAGTVPQNINYATKADYDQLAGPGIGVVVLIFAAADCPISNRYVPEIARLNRKFSAQGVRISWVFPNPADTAGVIAQHNRDFAISEPTLLDTRQTLVHLAHVSITPEAAVFKWDGTVLREVYRGRIDDRFVALGQERPQPQHHDLEAAIASALAGQPIPSPAGPPVGCSIDFIRE